LIQTKEKAMTPRFPLLAVAAACATAAASTVPKNLEVPSNQQLVLRLAARGTQNYTCQQKAEAFEWSFAGPEADLFDERGELAGRHGSGPSWQLNDGSKVVGAVKEKAQVQGSIPWLLLEVKSREGQGTLSGVASVQRLDTAGGAPPASGCDAGHAGETVKVAYTANYVFYGTPAPR
jgi:hypothetical protein